MGPVVMMEGRMETTRGAGESRAEPGGARRTVAPQAQAGGEVRGNRSQIPADQRL